MRRAATGMSSWDPPWSAVLERRAPRRARPTYARGPSFRRAKAEEIAISRVALPIEVIATYSVIAWHYIGAILITLIPGGVLGNVFGGKRSADTEDAAAPA